MSDPDNTDPEGAAQGVEPFVGDFLARHRRQLLDHARWLMRGRPRLPDPEDVVQAASLSFCLYIRRQNHDVVDRGLLTLARQCVETALSDVIKWQAAKKRADEGRARQLPPSEVAPPVTGPGPATAAVNAERVGNRQRAVLDAMQTLDPLDRRIMELRLEDDDFFTFARIGELVGMQPDAVRMRYRRVIDRLKPVLLCSLAGDSEIERLANE
ncbi:MAG: sigma-70 family RNA polymerase sigma factor [Planctomycetes bacterium]|nr:sigma-70 family RNA polymerase sigma factor [Planctomycetota bacterium]